MNRIAFLSFVVFSLSAVSCSREYIKKVLKDNPEIIAEVIEENPKLIIDALNKASMKFRQEQIKAAQEQREKEMEDAFANPKKPEVAKGRAIFGSSDAPITIVEYSDFRCGYCKRAVPTMTQLLNDYKGKVRVIYKHLPILSPESNMAAEYYEAVNKEGGSAKAHKFHDKIFENQQSIGEGAKLFDRLVKEVGLDPEKVKKSLSKVKSIVEADKKEAEKFKFSGTPAFLVGGVPLSGAQEVAQFKKVIDRHISNMEKK